MTYSILARDPETGAMGGAAATGSLCVGGWVLRGDARLGMSASQGASPSTLWGEDVLKAMGDGLSAAKAVERITRADGGRAFRQLAAVDLAGGTGAFTGVRNVAERGTLAFPNGVASGNMLSGKEVLDALVSTFRASSAPFAQRLLEALTAAEDAGGDSRGLCSAALLIVSLKNSPLTLRVDFSDDPIDDLRALHARSQEDVYAEWARQVPTLDDPERALD